jgi:SAM-dependent methyltransferase
MAELAFDDSSAYERFIGRWGRVAGAAFLDWVDPPADAAWLDVGCGTGLFTELICDTRSPAAVVGIDRAEAQIACARRKPVATRALFQVGDAQTLPFSDSVFDVVMSALVINFIPDRVGALSEMRRVARAGGIVAGYVWDFVPERSPSGPFRLGMRDVLGDIPALPGTRDSELGTLNALFERAGFADLATTSIDVPVEFPDFDAFWTAQTPSYAPTTKTIEAMSGRDRARVTEAVRARIPTAPDGWVRYSARANAVRASVEA